MYVQDVFPGQLLLKNRENCLVQGKVEIRVCVVWEVGGSGSIAGEALGSIEEGPAPGGRAASPPACLHSHSTIQLSCFVSTSIAMTNDFSELLLAG